MNDVEKIIREHYSNIGKKGAASLLKKYGTSHFSELAKKKAAKQKMSVDKAKKPGKQS